ncbi:hypothetical protein ACFWHR_07760 [Leucobacter sp. NPDC058333]
MTDDERRAQCRLVLVEIAGAVLTLGGAIAVWQGLEWYAVATMSAV